MALSMFLIVTLPVILGMIIKKILPNFVLSFEPIAKKISIILFVLVLIGAILAERNNVIAYFAQAGLILSGNPFSNTVSFSFDANLKSLF